MNDKNHSSSKLDYLGTFTITPSTIDVEVNCYGIIQPEEKETLEHKGSAEYSELIKVTTEIWTDEPVTIDISNYISPDIWDELEFKINNHDKE